MSVKCEIDSKTNELVIRLALQPAQRSASGKTMVVASTRGNIATTAQIDGKPVTIGVNAYYRA